MSTQKETSKIPYGVHEQKRLKPLVQLILSRSSRMWNFLVLSLSPSAPSPSPRLLAWPTASQSLDFREAFVPCVQVSLSAAPK